MGSGRCGRSQLLATKESGWTCRRRGYGIGVHALAAGDEVVGTALMTGRPSQGSAWVTPQNPGGLNHRDGQPARTTRELGEGFHHCADGTTTVHGSRQQPPSTRLLTPAERVGRGTGSPWRTDASEKPTPRRMSSAFIVNRVTSLACQVRNPAHSRQEPRQDRTRKNHDHRAAPPPLR
jgi:hypothetical protein